METNEPGPGYYIWGVDLQPYGPVELPILVEWTKDERVIADTWVYSELANGWSKAVDLIELKICFPRAKAPAAIGSNGAPTAKFHPGIKPGSLRRIKIFADMDEDKLSAFLNYMEVVHLPAFRHVVRKGEPGAAMYLVLEGELRSCLVVDGIETPLAKLEPGNIFGEISLLDHGAHAADVITNQDSALIKISSEAFDAVVRDAPELALHVLLALSKSIAARVRLLIRRYEDSVHLTHATEVGGTA
jgi:hypothetical protein